MLLHAKDLAPGSVHAADVCIIGAGAAGITLARDLAARGRSVLVLEGGGFERTDDSQGLYDGKYSGTIIRRMQKTYMSWSRLRYFGGTTNHWGGWVRPLDAMDFQARDWVPESGWPLTRAQLDPWYLKATRLIEIKPFPSMGGPPTQRPGILRSTDRFVDRHYYFSPPTRFGQKYRADLVDAPKVRLVLGANVTRIHTAANNRVEHVVARAFGKAPFKAKARYYVLACGGIENPRILMHSGNMERGGLGNERDLVGRYFMDHPHLTLGTVILSERLNRLSRYRTRQRATQGHRVRAILAPTEEAMRSDRLLNFSLSLRPRKKRHPGSATMASLMAPGAPRRVRDVDIYVRSEQIPNRASRVVLTAARDPLGMRRLHLDWKLTRGDHEALYRAMRGLATVLGRDGTGRGRSRVTLQRPMPSGFGGCHHMGTTRMAADATRGIVDANCRMHSCPNLHIAGSSVFPTGGYANPTFTIVALALRLGEHLHGRLG